MALTASLAYLGTTAALLTVGRDSWRQLQAGAVPIGMPTAVPVPIAEDFEPLFTLAAAVAAWLCLTWLATGLILLSVASLPAFADGRLSRFAVRVTPALLRRIATGALGVAVAGGPAVCAFPAAAEEGGPMARTGPGTGSAQPLGPQRTWRPPPPLPDLDRPAAAPPAHASRATPADSARSADLPRRRVAAPSMRVVVQPGDTLWELAAARIGRHATPGAIARAWPRWYALNRHVIGPDPDLLLPGQILHSPAQRRPSPSADEETP